MTLRSPSLVALLLVLASPRPALTQETPEGGTWKMLAPTLRGGASTVYDPVRNRMILFGGNDNLGARSDVWALSLSGPSVWTQFEPTGEGPPPSEGHTAIYDPLRDRMIVFGGSHDTTECDPRSGCETFPVANDGVWELSLSTGTPEWRVLMPPGAAPPGVWRRFHCAIYDRIDGRMIVYGGIQYAGALDDVWSLSLGDTVRWSEIVPSGSTPGARTVPTAAFDPIRGRMLVFGCDPVGGSLGDMWSLSLVGPPAWTRIAPGGATVPVSLSGSAMVYDPVHDAVVVRPNYGALDPHVWKLSLSGAPRWSSMVPSGISPFPGGTAIYDESSDRLIFFGADLGVLSLKGDPTWEDVYPVRRDAPSVIYDPGRCRMVMFGGYRNGLLDDVWTLSMGPQPIWTRLNVAPGPGARYLHTAVYDPVRKRMVVFGGLGYTDVWALSLAGDPSWTQIPTQGTPPNDVRSNSAVYVPSRDEIWYFGGAADEVWSLDLGGNHAWHPVLSVGSALSPDGVYYEAAKNRIVACGNGATALWLGSLPQWSVIVPYGFYLYRSIYDPARNRVIAYHDPMRRLSLTDSTWAQVAAAGPPLSDLSYVAIVDPPNDRAVFYGSQDNSLRSLTWAAGESLVTSAEVSSRGAPVVDGSTFDSTPPLTARVPGVRCLDLASCVVRLDGADLSPAPKAEPQEAVDLALPSLAPGEHRLELRLVSFGARRVIGAATLSFRIVDFPLSGRLSLDQLHAAPNPARGILRFAFRLTKPADYTIDLYDLTGRHVARLRGRGVAGPNLHPWDGLVEGRRATSGYYIYQVTAADGSATVTAHGRALFLR